MPHPARQLRIGAAQYPLDRLASLAAYEDKLDAWVAEAARGGADLAVFPEYGAMEFAALDGCAGELEPSLEAVARRLPEIDALHARLSKRYGVAILAGTAPDRRADGARVNVARLFAPGGGRGRQEKLMPTPIERRDYGVAAGRGLAVFDLAVPGLGVARLGVAVCYDVEFPLIARALAEAGADVILAPSCTDAPAGWNRVRIGARARALENQCAVVQAPLVGAAPWCAAAEVNRGAAGVFGPPDLGFPEDGIIAEGGMDRPGWVHAAVDLAALAAVRVGGRVATRAHWPEQPREPAVGVVALGG